MSKLSCRQTFRAIAKGTVLAAFLALGCSPSLKAEEIKAERSIRVSENPFAISYSDEAETNIIAQGRTGRKKKRKVEGYYGGVSGGLGFPDGGAFPDTDVEFLPAVEYTNGFIGSLFGGVKFSKNISIDGEFLLALGGLNDDDVQEAEATNEDPDDLVLDDINIEGDYSAVAFYINPRFELPVGEKFNLYLSPGIGISQTNVESTVTGINTAGTEVDNIDDDNRTAFSYQVKGGATYAINGYTSIFGQVRYVSMPTVDDDTNTNDFDSLNIFATELGVKFNF